jgi:FkbM family methyltransferase
MTGWGSVIAIEAQERIYYALAGNIAINNCFNALAVNAAVSSESGTMQVPNPNYFTPSSFGSLELRQRPNTEFIGQQIDYTDNTVLVRKMTLDELNLPRVDFVKIDIEGMELEALAGARATINAFRPILLIEKIKTDLRQLERWLVDNGYQMITLGINILAIHKSDACLKDLAPQAAGQQPHAA